MGLQELSFFEMTMVISIDQLTTNQPLMTGLNLYWPLVWLILILTGQLPTLLEIWSFSDLMYEYVCKLSLVTAELFEIRWIVFWFYMVQHASG